MQAYNSHSYFRGVWCIWDTGDLDIPCQKGGNMERKRWGASVNHCVMSHPQKTWWSTSSHLYICFLRNESAPINYKATGCKISGLQLLLLGISAFYLHTGSVSGWRQVRTAVPGTTSSQRQREDVSSSVSFSGVRRSRPAYWAELDHTAAVSVRVQLDNEGHSLHSG